MEPSVIYASDNMGITTAILVAIMVLNYLLSFGFCIAMYIFQSLGIYTIAQRRGIKHPWMAWLPVTNLWILGSISDQYQYVTGGKIRSRRKVLLGLNIAMLVLCLVFFCAYFGVFAGFILQAGDMEPVHAFADLGAFLQPLLWVLAIYAVMLVLAVILTVFQYICLYNLYASCDPKNKTLYTVLSILLNVTIPFLIFVCRKKDLGMPPRKKEVQQISESTQT